ncbi:alpha-tectorin-like, partial [Scomber scombrus]
MFRGIWDSLDADAAPDVWCVFLVLSSCPSSADKTVKVEGNGLGTSNYFSFNMFQFSGKDGDVYLHCKLNLCVKKGNTCTP